MSGQISGQVPNQAATQLPSLPQLNGNYVPSQMQNLGGLRSACNMDQEFPFIRRRMQEKIFQYLQGQDTNHEMLPRVRDVAKRLEEMLLREASSKEEYINMESLEQRLQTLVRRFLPHNQTQHQQLPHLMSSTSSIGTMIPTPGNTGNLLATSNGSSGLRGVSFNPSDGAVANGSQSPANISVGSGGNNMMSAMSVPRMATQMIPTPGLNSPQSISVNSEYSNGGGFSSVESMVSQQHQHQHQQQQQLQQPKQYSGSQNSRILQGIGSQMGFGMRSNLQQKSSYGFPNGAMNGRLQLIGNNIQLMNGSAAPESYLNASPYANSQKPLQQQSDQQRHQQIIQTLPSQMILTGDMYGMNANDVSGSGNLYGPATSVGSTMNNQNVNHMNLQSKPKTNSGMLTNQPNLQTIQQLAHIKTQIVDQSAKMSYQSPHSTREQLMQTQQQMQKFQQQQIQQPQYAQFVEHQHQQKQQTQQHQQLLLKNDILREPQLSFSAGGQIISEDGMEAHHEALQAQISEHYHLSEFQNQYQQKNAAPEDYSKGAQMPCHPSGAEDFHSPLSQTSHQMQQQQQMLHSHQQMVESQNDFSCLSTGSLQEALLQGQWHPQPLENFQHEQSHQPSVEQHIQEEFHQRITGRDEAQRPRFSSEGSLTTHTDVSKGAPQQASTEVIYRAVTVRHAQDFKKQQRWLHLLRHARCCPAPEGKCISACISVKKLWRHMESCSSRHCQFPRCHQSTLLLEHHRNCRSAECPVCIPCHQFWARLESQFIPLLDTRGASESVNGTWRNVDDSKMTTKNGTSTTKIPEDLQPFTKRTKMDNQSLSIIPKSESCPVQVAFGSQSHTMQLAQPLFQSCQEMEVCVPVRSEAMEVKIEQFSQCFRQAPSPAFADVNKDVLDGGHGAQPDVEPKTQNELYGHAKQDNMLVKEADQLKVEVKQDIAQPADQLTGSKSGKPKIKAVSMTELFTPEQVREHIKGLRQWVGQSRAKAEKNQAMENSMSENSCQLCAVEKLTFEPPPIYCTQCGARIKRNAMYYTMGTGDTRHYFCIPCYNEVRGDTIEADGAAIPKARLEKKRNDEETEEWWVQCDKCEAWQHQICALFNGRRNDGGQAEYTCPNCYIEEVERGERKPLPQSAVLGAKDLPRTILSDHIEQRLARRLKQERHERARVQGKSVDEVPGAEALVIRVVSSVDKKLEVKQRFLEIFQDENYPVEFPYKSKVVLLFQKIEGVEVCLFGMYVQEFGSECQFPNQRRVYLSYLDSVKYFRPEIRTVTGEALRTFVYHEILIGYLEYCKRRGFTSCYIWACPPLKGEDYILYCHPEIQKTPKSDKLREWYLSMLRKAARENIVVDLTNLYDHFFIQVGESKAKVTAARLPYFDGDYWPGAAEDMINQLRQEEDGRKQQKKGKTKKTITKRALKAAGQADLSGNASKDALLMQKLGETICPMKEDFIMVHLQHACNHCCHLLVTGKRWACGQCKNFQLCNRCHEAEQKLEERERHPANSREKHSFTPVEINDVPADTKDKDEILESEFFDTRQAFLSLCQGNHYQYDTLRRAKHSSMMVLYHLHNPTAPAFVTTCNVCHHDIETGQGWRCEICPDFDVCNACYHKTGGADHPHKLTNHPSTAERDAQNTEAREKRVLQLRIMLDLLVHASQCRFPHCKYPKCRQVKGLFRHGMQCRIRASGGCLTCKKMWYLLQLHARACKESECHVPRCKDLKEHMRRLQQQSDSRRRAAVMEMMRQRAAEVAGNSG